MTNRGSSPSSSVCCTRLLSSRDATALKHRGVLFTAHLAHRFCRFKGAAAHKDGEPAEEALFLCRQQVVAPLQGVAQRLLAGGQVLRSSRQDLEPVREPLQQRLGRQEFAAGCGQFDGQRQAVQVHADLGDGAGIGRGHVKGRLDGLRAQHKEAYCSLLREGISGEGCCVRSGTASGETGNSCSPERWRAARLVTSMRRRGQEASREAS